jgi:hypothetical protein
MHIQSQKSSYIPYIPPSYYTCIETNSAELLSYYYYYNRYSPIPDVENVLNGHVFVLKNITITDSALKYATSKYIWVDGIIQCYFGAQNNAKGFTVNEKVDVVGINTGIGRDYAGTLIFTGCIFLPAGSVQLPLDAGSGGMPGRLY